METGELYPNSVLSGAAVNEILHSFIVIASAEGAKQSQIFARLG
jgi:hypothetical protein